MQDGEEVKKKDLELERDIALKIKAAHCFDNTRDELKSVTKQNTAGLIWEYQHEWCVWETDKIDMSETQEHDLEGCDHVVTTDQVASHPINPWIQGFEGIHETCLIQ